MKFYLIHNPDAPDIERTQAEAKASGFRWEAIERPSDHAGIVALVKEFRASAMTSTVRQVLPQPEPEPKAAPPAPAPAKDHAGIHPRIVEIMNATEVEHFIWNADAERIAKIRAVLEERERDLIAKAVETLPPAPAPRIRKRG